MAASESSVLPTPELSSIALWLTVSELSPTNSSPHAVQFLTVPPDQTRRVPMHGPNSS